MLDIVTKSRYWKCDECKTTHNAERPITGEEADRKLICCPSGIFMPIDKEEVDA